MTQQDPIVIVGAARTPMGSFQGDLKEATAPELGSVAIREALSRAGVSGSGPGASGQSGGGYAPIGGLYHYQ